MSATMPDPSLPAMAPTSRTRPVRPDRVPVGTAGVVGLMVLMVLALAACTSSAETSGPAEVPGATAATEDEQVALEEGQGGLVSRLEVDDDWQVVVDATPPGTTFVIAAGEHRGFQVAPRSDDRFIGEDGALLNGSEVVDTWMSDTGADAGRWIADGFAPDSEPRGELLDNWLQEGYRQELFLDGERLLHVESDELLESGSWRFDFGAERLIMGDDPTGRMVELSVTPWAFFAPGSDNVTFENLEVKQYASESQGAAIDGDESTDWTITNVNVHHNHAGGIRFDRGTQIFDSRINDNGQVGINGAQEDGDHSRPVLVINNEVNRNGYLHYVWFWETGGIKLTYAEQAVVHNNVVLDNRGPGIWYDLDCVDGVITNNIVRNNSAVGIFYEISDRGTIARNEVTGNGHGIVPEFASGIWLSNSGNTAVVDNVLSGNTNEIIIVAAPREEFGYLVADNLIADNDITISDGFVGLSVVTGQDELYDPDVNQFRTNTYTLDGCEPCFFWDETIETQTWLELGNDNDSTFTGDGTPASGADTG